MSQPPTSKCDAEVTTKPRIGEQGLSCGDNNILNWIIKNVFEIHIMSGVHFIIMVIIRHHIFKLFFLLSVISTCLHIAACSGPTEPLTPNSILEILLDIPAVPTPPETEENASNPAYQLTRQYCQTPEVLITPHKSWIQLLLDNEVIPVKEDNTWMWTLDIHGESFMLTVIVQDTLFFSLDWTPSDKHREGWVLSNRRASHVQSTVEYFEWEYDDETIEMECLLVTNLIKSFHSTSDGGWIQVNNISSALQIFRATWNNIGHGEYQTVSVSGNW